MIFELFPFLKCVMKLRFFFCAGKCLQSYKPRVEGGYSVLQKTLLLNRLNNSFVVQPLLL